MSDGSTNDDSNELQRLEALRRYNLLDTEPEQGFDDLTRLAAQICGTPSALVSLVDGDRQWFKSRLNFEPCETSRDISFCTYTIQSGEILEVPDARKDERFRDNPLVTGPPFVTYYAGAPLKTQDGFRLGTLCVIDTQPNKLSEPQTKALEALARQASSQIELSYSLAQVSRSRQQLRDQLRARAALETAQRLSERFMRATIDSLHCSVAIVDSTGNIVHVNNTWREFAINNGGAEFLDRCGPGVNYLEVCDIAAARGCEKGAETAAGLRNILERTTSTFELKYPCHAPSEQRWFEVRVTAFGQGPERHAVLVHRNVTDQHLAQKRIAETNESLESRVRERTSALQRTTDTLRLSERRLLESEAQLRALTTRLQKVREDERTAISREIHDQLGQMLTAVKIDVSLLAEDLRSDSPPDADDCLVAIEAVRHLVDATIDSVREIARQLRPEVLDALGLAAAIEWHAEEFEARSGIVCALETSREQPRLGPDQRSALFRICQESLTNVARHANADKVWISLNYADGTLELTIADNGCGIDPGTLVGTRSLGVVGMRERAATIGATFEIVPRTDKGTRVSVRLADSSIDDGKA